MKNVQSDDVAHADWKAEMNRERQHGEKLSRRLRAVRTLFGNKSGMEMVQVAILIALAIALGLIFKTQITAFVNSVFQDLNA